MPLNSLTLSRNALSPAPLSPEMEHDLKMLQKERGYRRGGLNFLAELYPGTGEAIAAQEFWEKLTNMPQPFIEEGRVIFPGVKGETMSMMLAGAGAIPVFGGIVRGGKKVGKILGQFPTSSPGRIQNKLKAMGGYSVSPQTGVVPDSGIMMGKYRNTDPRNIVTDKVPTRAELEGYAKLNRKDWEKADHYLGVWKDPDTGKTYLDVSKRYNADEVRKATKAGERTGQLAGWNLSKGEEIPVGNWEDYVKSDEFAARMNEMESAGSEYLKNHPTAEWWDMHNTSFEDVYGKEQLPHVAGYTATTAPNTSPRENLQTMSEYMRREIAREPIIQPDWRVPEGAMSRQAGTKLGMESGRAKNLIRTHEGRLHDLSADNVRNEAEAMMGDPTAVVLDRHWARIAEDPIQGVYTAVQEGVVPPGKTYEALKDAVAAAAYKKGRDPRDYSADVWTGIRETIKNKSELFGVKYAKGSIQGESKGYADIFDDLIREKAEHLGISNTEMRVKLGKGDANLLSLILTTPLGMALYRESQQDEL